jgi:hypothetical protein
MVRPHQAHGRPNTAVVPERWEEEHAHVVRKTTAASISIWPAKGAGSTPSIGNDLSYATPAAQTALYEGAARIQVLNAGDNERVFGGEYLTARGYLVVIDRDSDPAIDRGAVVEVTEAGDPSLLTSRRLVVAAVDRGSLRWERDLYCVDTTIPTPG